MIGKRYECTVCPDYNLCQSCKYKETHSEHNFMIDLWLPCMSTLDSSSPGPKECWCTTGILNFIRNIQRPIPFQEAKQLRTSKFRPFWKIFADTLCRCSVWSDMNQSESVYSCDFICPEHVFLPKDKSKLHLYTILMCWRMWTATLNQ